MVLAHEVVQQRARLHALKSYLVPWLATPTRHASSPFQGETKMPPREVSAQRHRPPHIISRPLIGCWPPRSSSDFLRRSPFGLRLTS